MIIYLVESLFFPDEGPKYTVFDNVNKACEFAKHLSETSQDLEDPQLKVYSAELKKEYIVEQGYVYVVIK